MKKTQDAGLTQEAPMEQVRDLLFGTQLKDMEIRFQRQEERFLREIGDVREAVKSRMDSLENFMKSENGSLLHRMQEERADRDNALKSEQRERNEAIKAEQRERAELFKIEQQERSGAIKAEQQERMDAIRVEQRERVETLTQIGKDLASSVEAFERKLTRLASSLDAMEHELRGLLMAENGTMASKVEERYQDALGVISSTAAQIRHDMVYRSALSGMFTEIAVKLSGQWSMEVGQLIAGALDTPNTNGEDAPIE